MTGFLPNLSASQPATEALSKAPNVVALTMSSCSPLVSGR